MRRTSIEQHSASIEGHFRSAQNETIAASTDFFVFAWTTKSSLGDRASVFEMSVFEFKETFRALSPNRSAKLRHVITAK
jgi:hypothetical protein